MTQLLTLDDLFAVGIGFDLAGAYLLGRGLLASPTEILSRATPRWGFHAGSAVSQAKDRVDALAGVTVLGVGFVVQALAYALKLVEPTGGRGSGAALLVGGLAVVTAAATLLAFAKLARCRLLSRLIVDLARFDSARRRQVLPSGERLQDFGMELGLYATEAEVGPGGAASYARRVFGVKQVRSDADVSDLGGIPKV